MNNKMKWLIAVCLLAIAGAVAFNAIPGAEIAVVKSDGLIKGVPLVVELRAKF